MNLTETVSVATLIVAIFSGLGVPMMIYGLKVSNDDRTRMRLELHERLDHLDKCLDDTRQSMLSRMVTKDDLNAHRLDIQETVSRIRDATSRENLALHERVMRLENRLLGLAASG